ncbi:hypothetical protein A8F94_15335 [Bacillus sp. FJAT-27225]|uniref:hypothetical protein n=1 Tax=Bacillus sp. FJAT-27225 TaxID=1743144 RepID=UPI00080C266E|nr:hypothetical protein [Bacillus sp. FJAT-27225]OCA84097.1 hypothetical protein A8F94_15335 [Bacillus sp. FJAT-27225]
MLAIILILIAIFITGISLWLSKEKKKARIKVGLSLIVLSILSFPMLAAIFAEWKAIEGVASLMAFNLTLLIGGSITLIAGFFTKYLS